MVGDSLMVVGFDGCPQGWIGCLWRGPGHGPAVAFLRFLVAADSELPTDVRVVAVDIPLGLQDIATPGGRRSDRPARKLLGLRGSSVFSPPVRTALRATNHAEATRLNRLSGPDAPGISIQAFGIFPKLRDAEEALAGSAWLRERTIEVHPEVCFATMAGGPLINSKKRAEGRDERRQLLHKHGFVDIAKFELSARFHGAAADDALDACAAAWTAWRRAHGSAQCLPPDADGPDHWMRIWY